MQERNYENQILDIKNNFKVFKRISIAFYIILSLNIILSIACSILLFYIILTSVSNMFLAIGSIFNIFLEEGFESIEYSDLYFSILNASIYLFITSFSISIIQIILTLIITLKEWKINNISKQKINSTKICAIVFSFIGIIFEVFFLVGWILTIVYLNKISSTFKKDIKTLEMNTI